MNIGKKIHGFCNGYFGRENYETKTIIFEGSRWIVVVHEDETIACVNFDSAEEKQRLIDEWNTFRWDSDY